MVESILGRQQAEDIFVAAALSGIVGEKRSGAVAEEMEKMAGTAKAIEWLSKALGAIPAGLKSVWGAGEKSLGLLSGTAGLVGKTALLGTGAGFLGANAYDIIKQHVTEEDPETELKNKIEAIYAAKKRELEDSRWMGRVRKMRDELRRGYKKMTTEEYAEKYKELSDALDERKF